MIQLSLRAHRDINFTEINTDATTYIIVSTDSLVSFMAEPWLRVSRDVNKEGVSLAFSFMAHAHNKCVFSIVQQNSKIITGT